MKQDEVSELISENDAIPKRIFYDFDRRRINQPKTQQTNQPWIILNDLDSRCISFCTSRGKIQLNTSQDDTKLRQLKLSANKFSDAA